MPSKEDVAGHYANASLTAKIREGLSAIGKTPETVTLDDLAPVDEFHIGGRKATAEVLDQVALSPACTCSTWAAAWAVRRASSTTATTAPSPAST